MMRTTLPRLGALAALLAFAAPAAAQEPPEIQSWRITGWSFTPTVAVGALFDSNVAVSSPRADLGETEGDTLFNVQPSGQLEYIGRRTDFSTTYRGHLRRYMDTEGLNGFDQRVAVNLKRLATRRLTFYVRNSYADSPTTDEVELNGVPFRRTGSRSNNFGAGIDARVTRFVNMSSRYDATWVEFDRPDQSLAGGWIHGLRTDAGYQITPRLSLGGEYAVRRAFMDEGGRELAFHDVGGVLRYALGPATSVTAASGFALMNDITLDERRTGPYFRGDISHQGPFMLVGAGFQRHFVPAFGFGGSSRSQEVRGYVQTPFARRRLYVNGSVTWRRTDPFEAESLQLDTLWLRSSVGYSATRWARVEGHYSYSRQDSIITGGEIDRHRVGAQVVISQPMRIR